MADLVKPQSCFFEYVRKNLRVRSIHTLLEYRVTSKLASRSFSCGGRTVTTALKNTTGENNQR